MQVDILNTHLQAFLSESKKTSKIEVMDDDDKSEIIEIANKRGISLKDSKDLAGFKGILTVPDIADANGQRLPKEELLKALPSIIGKPLNINHQRDYVIGSIIDYRYSKADNKAIIYGVLYKSNFEQEFEDVKKYFKTGQLGISSEIWSPRKSWKYHTDGTFSLSEMEMAGAAIVIPPDVPAVEGARILAMAKKSEIDLVFASKYDAEEIMVAQEKIIGEVINAELPAVEVKKEEPVEQPKTKCANCQEEFLTPNEVEIKCPKCFAIIDKTGAVVYPPQVFDFHINCPNKSCGGYNWLKKAVSEDGAVIKCKTCAKEYDIKFAAPIQSQVAKILDFVYSADERCPQCGYTNSISGVSNIPERTLTCSKCKLKFKVNVLESCKKVISSISEANNVQLQGSTDMTEQPIVPEAEVVVPAPLAAETPAPIAEPVTVVEPVAEPQQATVENVTETPVTVTEATVEPPKEEVVVEPPKAEEVVAPVEVVKPEEAKEATVEEVAAPVVAEAEVAPVVAEEVVATVEVAVPQVSKEDKTKKRLCRVIGLFKEERKETEKKITEMQQTIETLKTSAKQIVERRIELGEYAANLTDEQILDAKDYQIAQLNKATKQQADEKVAAELAKANSEVATAKVSKGQFTDDQYARTRKEIDDKAFGWNK